MLPAEGHEPATQTEVTYAKVVTDTLHGRRVHLQPCLFSDINFLDLPAKMPGRYKGFPAVSFSENDVQVISSNFQFPLVGTFPKRRPHLSAIRKALEAIFRRASSIEQNFG
ncbi:unnamed protein product [Cuscuta epithymum]|uniref:Uncharacterized protein n=1 Tax=Cuscuta epithymum TaxID=186058 RepID=A0AAV0FSQ6_9ASTE|nr:unnamed protein product [Cuscuta epithymum]